MAVMRLQPVDEFVPVDAAGLLDGRQALVVLAPHPDDETLGCGALLVICYVLDNCDGEIAVLKDQCSEFGAQFDTFVDWVVHAGFFAALGMGTAAATGEAIWLWMGGFGAAGGPINYFLGLWLDGRKQTSEQPSPEPEQPNGWKQWSVYIFRELFRADFCFIVLLLAVFDSVWWLLPAGAIGAQVYWISQLVSGARNYHV